MSLILDALKQSEGDRQDAAGTIGLSAYNQPAKQSKHWVTWLLSSILLLNIIILGWYLFSSVSKPEAPVKETPPQTAPPAAPVVPKVIKKPVRQISPAIAAPAPPKAPQAVKNPLPTRPLSAEIGNTKKPTKKLVAIDNTPTLPPPSPTAVISTPKPVDKPPLESGSQNKTPPVTAQQPVDEPFGDTLRLADVADSVRIKLAAFEINAHVYSDIPEKRFALINMQRIEEGDSLSTSGYKLVEILPAGLVFDYGKGKVLLPLHH
ncbi:MAG TPA: hypothetical protein DD827_09385 [Gammaproteobacteria bacterium]|jgi:general secretion pathway protein B|nr:hypothetical protein [Gammaproteobacteria bacterium]